MDNFEDDPNPPPLMEDPHDGRTGIGFLFILKSVCFLILPSILYFIFCQLIAYFFETSFSAVWREGTLWVAACIAPLFVYFSHSLGSLAMRSKKMKILMVFVLSLLIAGYLYAFGWLYALFGLITFD